MRKPRSKTEATAEKIKSLFLLLDGKGELSFREIKNKLKISSAEFNSLVCVATDVLPLYETDDKKLGLLSFCGELKK